MYKINMYNLSIKPIGIVYLLLWMSKNIGRSYLLSNKAQAENKKEELDEWYGSVWWMFKEYKR
jgi:hypothetical protein